MAPGLHLLALGRIVLRKPLPMCAIFVVKVLNEHKTCEK
jgi:hypothetical protein